MYKQKKNRNGKKQLGQALTEFALVSPVLLMLAFGIIDFARTIFVYSMTLDALREASRNASVLGYDSGGTGVPRYRDCDRIKQPFEDLLFLGDISDNSHLTIEHILFAPGGGEAVWPDCSASESDLENGDILRVSVTFDIEFITPLSSIIPDIGAFFRDGVMTLDLSSQRTIVKQIDLGDASNPDDTDFDGLDDTWEQANCGNLSCTALDDLDGDGLTNGREEVLGTNPNDKDTDGDGVEDRDEVDLYNTNPLEPDTDFDGLDDYAEITTYATDPNNPDSDGDGLLDGVEVFQTDPRYLPGYNSNPNEWDTDGDGINDFDELEAGTNPGTADTDGDGLSDLEEANFGTDPLLTDTDSDGLTDPQEVNFYPTDPIDPDSDDDGLLDGDEINIHNSDPMLPDSDGDGLLDGDEVAAGTDPNDPDSDDDNLGDAAEVHGSGTDPNDPDSDGDGLTDYQEVVVYVTEPFNFDPLNPDTYGPDAYANDYDYLIGEGGDPNQGVEDSDGDLLPDVWEISWWGSGPTNICDITTPGVPEPGITDPLECQSGLDDFDGDGSSNYLEFLRGTNPRDGDTDNDGISDGNEIFTYGTDPFDPDTDDDGLLDGEEVNTYNSNPLNPDTDGDTLLDGEEVYGTHPLNTNGYKTDPRLSDTDGDGLNDYDEIATYGTNPLVRDTDGDGLEDGEEVFGTHPDNVNGYISNPLLVDTDGDGLNDYDEIVTYGTDPNNVDTDGDGLQDGDEVNTYNTLPNDSDTDNDGLTDGQEVNGNHPDNTNGYTSDPLDIDTDGDLLSDFDEITLYGTNPNLLDHDSDGLTDGEEVLIHGTLPTVADSEGDGVLDGDEINNPDGYLDSSDPYHPNSDQADEDFWDGAGVCNLTDDEEVNTYNTDPTDWDTDDDGISDCMEILAGTDPLAAILITINDVTITEPARSNQTVDMIFTVSLSQAVPAGQSITVNYASADFTAIAGQDYTQARGRITFNPGDSTATIIVVVNGDQGGGAVEGTETFTMNLSNPTGGRIDDPTGVGTILDED